MRGPPARAPPGTVSSPPEGRPRLWSGMASSAPVASRAPSPTVVSNWSYAARISGVRPCSSSHGSEGASAATSSPAIFARMKWTTTSSTAISGACASSSRTATAIRASSRPSRVTAIASSRPSPTRAGRSGRPQANSRSLRVAIRMGLARAGPTRWLDRASYLEPSPYRRWEPAESTHAHAPHPRASQPKDLSFGAGVAGVRIERRIGLALGLASGVVAARPIG